MDNETVPRDPLTVKCVHCGGAVPVVISRPALHCPSCGHARPFPETLAAAVERLMDKLRRTPAREQQLVGRQARLGRSYSPAFFLTAMVILWVLVGGIVALTIPLPQDISLGSFLFQPRTAAGDFDTAVAKWWSLWSIFTAMTFSFALYARAVLKIRKLVTFALPQTPAAPGRPPRCRCCGADLPAGTAALRRCEFCGVDHILQGSHYQEADARLEDALARMEKSLDVTLATRNRRAQRAVALAGILPVITGVLMPLGLFWGATRPVLWLVPFLLLAGGVLLMVLAYRHAVPAVRAIDDIVPGDTVSVKRVPYQVEAVFNIDLNAPISGILAILAPQPDTRARFGLHIDRDLEDNLTAAFFTLAPGGEPLPAGRRKETCTFSPFRRNPAAWNVQRLWFEGALRLAGPANAPQEIRLWNDPQQEAGTPPLCTLTRTESLADTQLLLLSQ